MLPSPIQYETNLSAIVFRGNGTKAFMETTGSIVETLETNMETYSWRA